LLRNKIRRLKKIKNKLDNQDMKMEIEFRYVDELLENRNTLMLAENGMNINLITENSSNIV